jgi:hypothetical protein
MYISNHWSYLLKRIIIKIKLNDLLDSRLSYSLGQTKSMSNHGTFSLIINSGCLRGLRVCRLWIQFAIGLFSNLKNYSRAVHKETASGFYDKTQSPIGIILLVVKMGKSRFSRVCEMNSIRHRTLLLNQRFFQAEQMRRYAGWSAKCQSPIGIISLIRIIMMRSKTEYYAGLTPFV